MLLKFSGDTSIPGFALLHPSYTDRALNRNLGQSRNPGLVGTMPLKLSGDTSIPGFALLHPGYTDRALNRNLGQSRNPGLVGTMLLKLSGDTPIPGFALLHPGYRSCPDEGSLGGGVAVTREGLARCFILFLTYTHPGFRLIFKTVSTQIVPSAVAWVQAKP